MACAGFGSVENNFPSKPKPSLGLSVSVGSNSQKAFSCVQPSSLSPRASRGHQLTQALNVAWNILLVQ